MEWTSSQNVIGRKDHQSRNERHSTQGKLTQEKRRRQGEGTECELEKQIPLQPGLPDQSTSDDGRSSSVGYGTISPEMS